MSLVCFVEHSERTPINIELVSVTQFASWLAQQDESSRTWLQGITKHPATAGNFYLIPHHADTMRVIAIINNQEDYWIGGNLAANLPPGIYTCAQLNDNFIISWGLGAYRFNRYKTIRKPNDDLNGAQLLVAPSTQEQRNIVAATYLVRDLINTPSEDLGPTELAAVAVSLAEAYHATVTQIIGDDLLKHHYHSVHTVGRASDDPPRVVQLRWGNPEHPRVSLIGKGVCFDSGGLDLKSPPHMLHMKKDMAGAAHVLALAQLIMQENLPINLSVTLPLVENVVSGRAYRPDDIITSKQGMTIEIGNTDAEGRLILADALTAGLEHQPKLMINIATLTGAARVALGTDLAALFSNDDALANDVLAASNAANDPMWRLPLYQPYRELLDSPIADINNVSAEPYGGAITAALFLQEFVPATVPWLHLDIMAYNTKTRHGRPIGGEAHGLRALFYYLRTTFADKITKS